VKPNPGRLDLTIYPHRVDISTRFADIDPLWHLNNVRIMELYQEARISFNSVHTSEIGPESAPKSTQGRRVLVARQSIDYLGEVQWPAVVTIGVGVSRVGTTSYSLALAMFHKDKCVGVSDTVLVYALVQGPVPIPEALRDALRKKMLPESAR
jgi:acyl-CoA thioester hydrolase